MRGCLSAIIAKQEVVACISFRMLTMLARGKILYIDDLITKAKHRQKGYGKSLLDHVIQIAKNNLCGQIHLDTGYARHEAHCLYLNHGFKFDCHHLALHLK